MSQYDVAIGINHDTLDQGFSELYTNQKARNKLFKGEQQGEQSSLKYTANWDVQQSPTIILSSPSQEQWLNSIDQTGQHPNQESLPTTEAFQLVFPQFKAEYTMGDAQPVSGITKVIVFVQVSLQQNQLSFNPLSVWFDQSKLSGWDQLIINGVILKEVLGKAKTMLSGINIPSLSFAASSVTLELTEPLVSIENSLLIMAASLKSKAKVDISGVKWPENQPLFILMSPDVVTHIAQSISQTIVGQTFADKGKKSGMNYEYSAKIDIIDSISSNNNDMTKISANLGFSFQATLKPLDVGGPCAVSAATSSI